MTLLNFMGLFYTVITSKAALHAIIDEAGAAYALNGLPALVAIIHDGVLREKARFPLLEHLARQLYSVLPTREHMALADAVVALDETGSYVVGAMILQLRMEADYALSLDKAVEFIVAGNKWYVCDIVGERTLGHAMLTQPERTLRVLQALSLHPDKWVVRAIGVATHYAVKKGLPKNYAREAFRLLLQQAATADFHTRKGIGWAAKTVAKFHPDIIEQYREGIENAGTQQWFRTKVNVGLGRAFKYAGRYTR